MVTLQSGGSLVAWLQATEWSAGQKSKLRVSNVPGWSFLEKWWSSMHSILSKSRPCHQPWTLILTKTDWLLCTFPGSWFTRKMPSLVHAAGQSMMLQIMDGQQLAMIGCEKRRWFTSSPSFFHPTRNTSALSRMFSISWILSLTCTISGCGGWMLSTIYKSITILFCWRDGMNQNQWPPNFCNLNMGPSNKQLLNEGMTLPNRTNSGGRQRPILREHRNSYPKIRRSCLCSPWQ